MPMLIIQLAILIAAAFVIGCILGRLLRRGKPAVTDNERVAFAAALSAPVVEKKPEPVASAAEKAGLETDEKQADSPQDEDEPAAEEKVEATTPEPIQPEEPAEEPGRPEKRDAPRRGKPDDLTAIAGIGKAVEAMLHEQGIFHYDQIAQWTADESTWIEGQIGFAGRVTRENWVAQAAKLAESTAKPARSAKPKTATAKPRVRKTTTRKKQAE